VLTAGHVILDNMDNLTVKIGSWAPRQEEATAETIAVQQYILHPEWNMTDLELFQNDYMIIQLTEPSNHTPIALNRDPNVPTLDNATVTMMGLGWTMPTTLSPSTIVQETLLTCIGNQECESAVDPLRYNLSYAVEIDETMLCTISPPNTTHDGCAWDSGDPVIVKGKTASHDVLVALGSSGVTCADPVFPGLFLITSCSVVLSLVLLTLLFSML
jgi:secreted trypsin-like serine protease